MGRAPLLAAVVAAVLAAVPAGAAAQAPGVPDASALAAAVGAAYQRHHFGAAIYGVWRDGQEVTVGAVGRSEPGVPASTDMHFRIGNTAESFLTTLLVRYAEQGRLRLDDPLSKWMPSFPRSGRVTLDMLAHSTSGYADYVTSNAFSNAFDADPFHTWTPNEVLSIAKRLKPKFAPGRSWGFSDTNFVLLAQVLERVDGRPIADQFRAELFDPLGMTETSRSPLAPLPSPVLHVHTTERGVYEDSTFWSPSFVPGAGDSSSDLRDLGRWAEAMGTGSLLSPASHALQTGPALAGVGPFTKTEYYGMGLAVFKGWILVNPLINDYSGIVAYHVPTHTAVVVEATLGKTNPPINAYGTVVFKDLAKLLTPGDVPSLPAAPRKTTR
jgi:D-alanyl-D-alanine carboxypeptidase